MAGPWERYAGASSGPWSKYQSAPAYSDVPVAGGPAQMPTQPDNASFMDKLTGAGEAALTLGSGALSSMAAPLVGLAGSGGNVKTADQRAGQFVQDYTYQPKTAKGAEYVDDLGKLMEASKLPPIMPSVGMAAPKVARVSSAIKPGIKQAGEVAVKTADTVAPNFATRLTPEKQALNAKARSLGIVLTPDRLSTNKFAKLAGEASENVPLSGARSTKNQAAWEKALGAQIGAQGDRLTPKAFDAAMRRSGVTIDAITRKYGLTYDDGIRGRFQSMLSEVSQIETPEVQQAVSAFVKELENKAASGAIDGAAFRKWNTKLGAKIRATMNGDLKRALSDIQDIALEQFNNGVTDKADAAKLYAARVQYAKAKTIAPIVGDPNGVSPAKLLGAIRNSKFTKELYARGKLGDMGDLADIGQMLKDPNSSNTAERSLVYGVPAALAGTGALNLPAAGAAVVGANLYNRVSPYFIRPKQ